VLALVTVQARAPLYTTHVNQANPLRNFCPAEDRLRTALAAATTAILSPNILPAVSCHSMREQPAPASADAILPGSRLRSYRVGKPTFCTGLPHRLTRGRARVGPQRDAASPVGRVRIHLAYLFRVTFHNLVALSLEGKPQIPASTFFPPPVHKRRMNSCDYLSESRLCYLAINPAVKFFIQERPRDCVLIMRSFVR
jgi:hypothetical protein